MQVHPADALRIETPDHIEFEYELAGVASRLCAAAVDAVLQSLIILALLIIFAVLTAWSPSGFLNDPSLATLGGWGIAFVTLGVFFALWLYPIVFETFTGGRTPGKRSLGIRVIQDNGTAITPVSAVVRNVLRAADVLPALYFLGLAVMLSNGRYKRIGDYAAGTVVIREKAQVEAPRVADWRQLQHDHEEQAVAEIRRAGVHRLLPDQIRMIEAYLGRAAQLSDEARNGLSQRIALPLSEQLGVDCDDPQTFLRLVLVAYRSAEAGRGRGDE